MPKITHCISGKHSKIKVENPRIKTLPGVNILGQGYQLGLWRNAALFLLCFLPGMSRSCQKWPQDTYVTWMTSAKNYCWGNCPLYCVGFLLTKKKKMSLWRFHVFPYQSQDVLHMFFFFCIFPQLPGISECKCWSNYGHENKWVEYNRKHGRIVRKVWGSNARPGK